mgnify:CR=1 FL=1
MQEEDLNENIAFTNWYADNEEQLKEDFLMCFIHEELREYILDTQDEEQNFFTWFERSFETFIEERWNNEEDLKRT